MVMSAERILCTWAYNAINCCHFDILHYNLEHLRPSRLSQNVHDYKQVNVLYIKFHSKSVTSA